MKKNNIMELKIKKKLKIKKEINDSWKIGYSKFGPFLFGMCLWLKKRFEEDNIESVYFLARDGYIIKKAFENIYGLSNKNHYLYLSRRSLALPSMIECSSIKDILNYLVLPPSFKISDLLSSLKVLSYEENILKNYNIRKDEIFYRKNLKNDTRVINLLSYYEQEIMINIKEQSKFFCRYLEQEKFKGNVAIVDIGWHNSIQFLINSSLKNNFDGTINGYYIGVYSDAKKLVKNNNVYGYLYNETIKEDDLKFKTFSFVSLLESFFLAQEGSTLSYAENGKKIVPVLNDYEYNEKNDMLKIIKNIQEGALEFCKDFKNNIEFIEGIDSKQLFNGIINLGINPSKKELSILSKLEFENFGCSNIINYNHNRFYYFLHLKQLKNDFYKSGWRIIFLKKLIPFPFPHYLFFKLLCKIFL